MKYWKFCMAFPNHNIKNNVKTYQGENVPPLKIIIIKNAQKLNNFQKTKIIFIHVHQKHQLKTSATIFLKYFYIAAFLPILCMFQLMKRSNQSISFTHTITIQWCSVAFQITNISSIGSKACSSQQYRKHQSATLLALCKGNFFWV